MCVCVCVCCDVCMYIQPTHVQTQCSRDGRIFHRRQRQYAHPQSSLLQLVLRRVSGTSLLSGFFCHTNRSLLTQSSCLQHVLRRVSGMPLLSGLFCHTNRSLLTQSSCLQQVLRRVSGMSLLSGLFCHTNRSLLTLAPTSGHHARRKRGDWCPGRRRCRRAAHSRAPPGRVTGWDASPHHASTCARRCDASHPHFRRQYVRG